MGRHYIQGIVMKDETNTGNKPPPPSPLEYLAKQIDTFKTIIWVLVLAFICGYTWNRLVDYERMVDKDHASFDALKMDIDGKFAELNRHINTFKTSLGRLSDPSYRIEASDEAADSGVCETGNVVTGVYHEAKTNRWWIKCTSISRAVWNPDLPGPPNTPGVFEVHSVSSIKH
jgi:hypothetical protein